MLAKRLQFEYSKFGFKQGTSMGVGWASGLAARCLHVGS
jgi:hypothetical protein